MCHFLPVHHLGIAFLGRVEGQNITKELSEDLKRRIVVLHEYGQGYKKIANTLKLSCSTVAKIIQHFKRAWSTQNSRSSKEAECTCWALHPNAFFLSVGVLSALLQRLKRWGCQPVSAQTIHRTLHQIGVHGCHPRRKPLLKMIHKKSSKQFSEDMSTKHMSTKHMVWWDED